MNWIKRLSGDHQRSTNLLVAAVVSLAVIGVGAALIATKAATSATSGESEAGVRTANVQAVNDTTASGGQAVKFSAPVTGTLYGWKITTTNVGLAPFGLTCSSLPVYTGPSQIPAGTTLSRVRFTSPLTLSAGNIIIEQSCMQPTSVWQGLPLMSTTDNDTGGLTPTTVTIRDSEIDGSKLSAYDSAFSTGFIGIANMQRNYIHGVGSGIALMNTGTSLDSLIENNYVRGLTAYGDGSTTGNHSDAFTVRDFSASKVPNRNLSVSNNRFDCDSPNATGAFFIQTYAGNINNLFMSGNLLEGDGYQLGLEAGFGNTYGNVNATNNRFSGTGWGPGYHTGGPGWTTWSENYINNPTQTDNKGTVVGKL